MSNCGNLPQPVASDADARADEERSAQASFDQTYMKWVAQDFVAAAARCEGRGETARALSRAIQVLHWLGAHPRGLSGKDLQSDLGIPKASLYRVLSALMDLALVEQDEKSRAFRVGGAALALGFFARASNRVARSARPILREISRETGQTAEVFVPIRRWRLVTVDIWPGLDCDPKVRTRPGSVGVINHLFAPGYLFLAFGDRAFQQEYTGLSRTDDGRQLLGLKTPAQDNLEDDFKRCRHNGVAWFQQSGRPGVGRMAAPVFDADGKTVIASVGFACAGSVMSPLNAARWSPLVIDQARKFSRVLAKPV